MTSFEKFLKENGIKKYEIAEYLGCVPSNITYYCKGAKLPEGHLERLSERWDTSALIEAQREGVEELSPEQAAIALLRQEIESLKQIINNQSGEIAILRTLVEMSEKKKK